MKTNRLQPIISNTPTGQQVGVGNSTTQVQNPEKMPASTAETKTAETKTEDQQSRKFDWNEGLNTVGDTLIGIFRKPDNITNITNNTMTDDDDNNTMLYVGIGGALLLVVLLIVFLR